MKEKLQRFSAALMAPIGVLPLAALLLGLGHWIDPQEKGHMLGLVLVLAGRGIFDYLGLFFSVGVAYSLSEDKHGAAALGGLAANLIILKLLEPSSIALLTQRPVEALPVMEGWHALGYNNVLIGILAGLIGAWSYQRFHQAQLPQALAFFSGRRLVPVMASLLALLASGLLFVLWPRTYASLYQLGIRLLGLGSLGAGLFGLINRLLVPFGFHHGFNSIFWFDLVGISDIARFWAGPGQALAPLPAGVSTSYYPGMYQAGFFPITLFGLPAAALAMMKKADRKNKKALSFLLTAILASVITGVTEPLEFSFVFLAPGLFLIHALLTGLSLGLAASLHLAAGFGYSSGLFDLVLSLRQPNAQNIPGLLLLGLPCFLVYYFIFSWAIDRFQLKTPGRLDLAEEKRPEQSPEARYLEIAENIVDGLGGLDNIQHLEHCATRLRITIDDSSKLEYERMERTGVVGIIKTSAQALQVIIGSDVQFVYDAIEMIKKIKENKEETPEA